MEETLLWTKWCVHCYPKKSPAYYIYKGNSICEECLKDINDSTRKRIERNNPEFLRGKVNPDNFLLP